MHPHLHTKDNKGKELAINAPFRSSSSLFQATNTYAECQEVMELLEECHENSFLYKMFGGCNQAKENLNKCLRAQRLMRTRLNAEKAKVAREQREKLWREIDEENS